MDYLEFYRHQGIFRDDADYEKFKEVIGSDIPVTFRVTRGLEYSNMIYKELDNMLTPEDLAITKVGWLPQGTDAYQINANKETMRKDAKLKQFRKYIVSNSLSGTVFRQELVSMIPVACMRLDKLHDQKEVAILDMCCAPGSKTAQILEWCLVNRDHLQKNNDIIIGNDLDIKRAGIVMSRMRRCRVPGFMVTQQEAQNFPSLFYPDTNNEGKMIQIEYDRVLADVPCSGDGTIRNVKSIVDRFNMSKVYGIHGLQKGILMRGLTLCKVGGIVIYSTCSLNPLENEAIASSVLAASEGSIIVDLEMADDMRKITGCRKGLRTWKVPCDKSHFFDDQWEARPSDMKFALTQMRKRTDLPLVGSMMPWHDPDVMDKVVEGSMRFMPHDRDSGGFYVIVFKKIRQVPWATDDPSKSLDLMDSQYKDMSKVADKDPSNLVGQFPCSGEWFSLRELTRGKRPILYLPIDEGSKRNTEILEKIHTRTFNRFVSMDDCKDFEERGVIRLENIPNGDEALAKKVFQVSDIIAHRIFLDGLSSLPLNIMSVGQHLFTGDPKQRTSRCVSLGCSWLVKELLYKKLVDECPVKGLYEVSKELTSVLLTGNSNYESKCPKSGGSTVYRHSMKDLGEALEGTSKEELKFITDNEDKRKNVALFYILKDPSKKPVELSNRRPTFKNLLITFPVFIGTEFLETMLDSETKDLVLRLLKAEV